MNDTEKNVLKGLLKTNVIKVTFTKVNGEQREMDCTLHQSYLPESIENTNTKKQSDSSISVWDVNLDSWRSFRWDSIVEYSDLGSIKDE